MEILGFLLAITSALSHAIKWMFQKVNLKDINSNALIFVLSWLSTLFWIPFIIKMWIPEISLKLLIVFILWSVLFYIWKLFHFKALQIEDISYISPLTWLVTVWVLILGIIILDEIPSIYWAIWVGFILIWVYFLNLQKYHTKFFEPIKHLYTNKWSQLFLISIICYSFTNILDKIWVAESYPIFWIFLMNLSLFVISSFKLNKTFKKDITFFRTHWGLVWITFFFYVLGHITQMTAIQYIFIWYMSAIKTASLLFTIILWWIFFKEKDILKKLAYWVLIVLWLVFIYLGK